MRPRVLLTAIQTATYMVMLIAIARIGGTVILFAGAVSFVAGMSVGLTVGELVRARLRAEVLEVAAKMEERWTP